MRRWFAILLLVMLGYAGSLDAQTSTSTPAPTSTATAIPTATATYDLYIYVTVVPPGESVPQGGAIKNEVTLGDVMIALLLFALLMLSIVRLVLRFRRGTP